MPVRNLLPTVVFLATTLCCCAQLSTTKPGAFPPDLLKQDFRVFRDTLKQLHAGLYRYRSVSELNTVFDSCYNALDQPMNISEYYLMIRFLIASIGDGHTAANMPAEVRDNLVRRSLVFPLQLRFINDRAYVACNSNKGKLPAGTEVTSINNRPIAEIQNNLIRFIASDGSNQTKKIWDLNHDAFVPFYYLVYGEQRTFQLKVRLPGANAQTINIEADSFQNVDCRNQRTVPSKNYELNFRNTVPVLTIRSFVNADGDNYYEFLENSFKEIRRRNSKSLIIDLRDNGGGHDVFGSRLFAYLTDKPFAYYTSLETTTRKLNISEHPNLSIQQPRENNFHGTVHILINGMSFSTTTEFCSIAKSNERAIFIGEETGGGYYGNTSGGNAQVILPNTKISVRIPKLKYTMAVKPAPHKDRGIIPDHIIIAGISDLIAGRDVQMDSALNLVAKQR